MAFGDFFKKAKQTVVGLAKKASDALVQSVQTTAKVFRSGLDFLVGRKVDDEVADRLRDTLISADVSPRMADELVQKVQEAYREREVKSTDEILTFLKEEIKKDFPPQESAPKITGR